MYAVYFALCFAYPAGMGFGDVKLAGVLGMATAWLGWGAWTVGLFLGFLAGGVFGVAARARAPRAAARPPCRSDRSCSLGALAAVLVGEPLAAGVPRLDRSLSPARRPTGPRRAAPDGAPPARLLKGAAGPADALLEDRWDRPPDLCGSAAAV